MSQATFLRGGSSVSVRKSGVGHWKFSDFGRSPARRELAEISDGAIGP